MLGKCQYCGKSLNTLGKHELKCPDNPKNIIDIFVNPVGVPCSKCKRFEEEVIHYRRALEEIRDMPDQVLEGISADGECSSHIVTPPDPRRLQRIAFKALEGSFYGTADD